MSGNMLMQIVKRAGIACEFIILTDTYSHKSLNEFFSSGGFDYWLKSFDIAETESMLGKLAVKLSSSKERCGVVT
jgi:DNA-binding NtrC family response regulator